MKQAFNKKTLWEQIAAIKDEDGQNYSPGQMEVYTKAFEKGVVSFRKMGDIAPLGHVVFKSHQNATDAILEFKKRKANSSAPQLPAKRKKLESLDV